MLYPLQNEVLRILNELETGFYLTGGTASSRGYLNHRFSDDLDLFVNDDDRFTLWAERVIQALSYSEAWQSRIVQSVTRANWELVRWIDAPEPEQWITDLQALAESLILLK